MPNNPDVDAYVRRDFWASFANSYSKVFQRTQLIESCSPRKVVCSNLRPLTPFAFRVYIRVHASRANCKVFALGNVCYIRTYVRIYI